MTLNGVTTLQQAKRLTDLGLAVCSSDRTDDLGHYVWTVKQLIEVLSYTPDMNVMFEGNNFQIVWDGKVFASRAKHSLIENIICCLTELNSYDKNIILYVNKCYKEKRRHCRF